MDSNFDNAAAGQQTGAQLGVPQRLMRRGESVNSRIVGAAQQAARDVSPLDRELNILMTVIEDVDNARIEMMRCLEPVTTNASINEARAGQQPAPAEPAISTCSLGERIRDCRLRLQDIATYIRTNTARLEL